MDSATPPTARERYVEIAQQLRAAAGLSYEEIASRARRSTTSVSATLRGFQSGRRDLLPTERLVRQLDDVMGVSGQLVDAWRAAALAQAIAALNIPVSALPGLLPAEWRTVDRTGEVGSMDANRRMVLGGISSAAVLAAVGAVDDEFRQATPGVVDLATAESALATLERDRNSVDPGILFPPGFEAWRGVEAILGRRVRLEVIPHLARLAGQLAAGLATVASFSGDDGTARAFAALAEKHAITAQVPILTARVAGLRSWMALDAGMPDMAADLAARGRQQSDPADHARLAAYEAEAASAAGDYRRAARAMQEMRAGQAVAERGPAALPWTPHEAEIYEAVVAGHTPGRGSDAIRHGEAALQCPTGCPCQGVALAQIAIGRGRLDGDHPRPDAAAAAALAALEVDTMAPNASTRLEARRLHRRLAPWPREPLVQELGQRLAAV